MSRPATRSKVLKKSHGYGCRYIHSRA
jgi:hypothetical protein